MKSFFSDAWCFLYDNYDCILMLFLAGSVNCTIIWKGGSDTEVKLHCDSQCVQKLLSFVAFTC